MYYLKDYDKAKNGIKGHEIILFDIYGTLLLFPYTKIENFFMYMNRVKIEKFKNSVFQPRLECVQLVNYAKQLGKRIILVCEKNFYFEGLHNLLEEKGISGWEKICIINNDSFFKPINLIFKDFFYIGNCSNFATKENPDYFYIPNLLDYLFVKEPRCKKYYVENKNDTTASIFLGLMSLNILQQNNNYWYNFGYIYAAPILYSYTKWLLDEFKKDNIEEILFVTRDGYIIRKIFDLIKKTEIKSHYVCASRKLFKQYMNCSKENESVFRNYIESLNISSRNIACVDSITFKHSCFSLLKRYLPDKNLIAYYYTVCKEAFKKNNPMRIFGKQIISNIFNWNVVEFYMTAPTPSIKCINNNKPVYEHASKYERKRINAVKSMEMGIMDFSLEAEKFFNGFSLPISPNQTVKLVNVLYNTLSERDRKYVFDIRYSENDDGKYEELFDNKWHSRQ